MRMHDSWAQNSSFAPRKNFFGKELLILFSYQLASFNEQNFKNFKKILKANSQF